jgi:hypothetical protein
VVVLDADDIADSTTTNKFTTAGDITKLAGIEASADVTDTTNVTAAGALMDSEVTNLAQVKAFDSADYATAAQGSTADAALQDVVEDTTPQLGGDLDLNGNNITGTGNIAITGSLNLNSNTAVTGFVDEDNMVSDSATLVPTQQSVKAYVDNSISASGGALDIDGDSGTGTIVLGSETLTLSGGDGISTSM